MEALLMKKTKENWDEIGGIVRDHLTHRKEKKGAYVARSTHEQYLPGFFKTYLP
jgi:hypothetical protein